MELQRYSNMVATEERRRSVFSLFFAGTLGPPHQLEFAVDERAIREHLRSVFVAEWREE